MDDWIDKEAKARRRGGHHPLLQSEHAAVNARYPGCTLEYCSACGEPTGKAGKGDGSLYCEKCDNGPLCYDCYGKHCDEGGGDE